jgi:hypothetical protein
MAVSTPTTAGQILTSAYVNNNINSGTVFIKSQTIGVGVGSTTVTGAFSAEYDNYKIVINGGVGSTIQNIGMYMGGSAPASGYFSSRILNLPNSGTPIGNGINNTGLWSYAGQASTNVINMNLELFNPFLAKYTLYNGSYILEQGANSELGTSAGLLNNTTSYTSFTIVPSGTLTGGVITVYGYREA